MSDFPPSGLKENSAQFNEETEDVSVRGEIEGGYVFTRARHTRTPRRTFTTGFTSLTAAELASLESFYQTKKGGSVAFTYTHPTTAVEYTVRFKGQLKKTYVGCGGTHLWDISGVTLEQV